MTALLIIGALCIGTLIALFAYALCRTSAQADRAAERQPQGAYGVRAECSECAGPGCPDCAIWSRVQGREL